jgi:hypothetical protein
LLYSPWLAGRKHRQLSTIPSFAGIRSGSRQTCHDAEPRGFSFSRYRRTDTL